MYVYGACFYICCSDCVSNVTEDFGVEISKELFFMYVVILSR